MYKEIDTDEKLLKGIERKLISFLNENCVNFVSIQHYSTYLKNDKVDPLHQIRVRVDDSENLETYRTTILRRLVRSRIFEGSRYTTSDKLLEKWKKGKIDRSRMGHVWFFLDGKDGKRHRIVVTLRSSRNRFFRAKEFEDSVLSELQSIRKSAIVTGGKNQSIVAGYTGERKATPEVLLKNDLITPLKGRALKELIVDTVSDATVEYNKNLYCVSVKEFTEKTVRIANYTLRKGNSYKKFLKYLHNNKYLTNLIKNSYRKNYIFCIRSKDEMKLFKFNGFGKKFEITNKRYKKKCLFFCLNDIPCKVLFRYESARKTWRMELSVNLSGFDIDKYIRSLGGIEIGNKLKDIFEYNGKWATVKV